MSFTLSCIYIHQVTRMVQIIPKRHYRSIAIISSVLTVVLKDLLKQSLYLGIKLKEKS